MSKDNRFDNIAKEVADSMTDLDYKRLFPVGHIFSLGLLRNKSLQFLLLFGLLPLAYFWIIDLLNLRVNEVLWLIVLYFALFWLVYFNNLIRPSSETLRTGLGYALFTIVIGIPLLLVLYKFNLIRAFHSATASRIQPLRMVSFILGVGILEETCKALPLMIFGIRKRAKLTINEWLFLGLLSGFGFAAAEGVSYILSASFRAVRYGDVSTQVVMLIERVMTGPLLHGAWAGIVGWFIGVGVQRSGKIWPFAVIGILLSATLHGLFNFYSTGPLGALGIVLAAISLIMFYGYLTYGERNT